MAENIKKARTLKELAGRVLPACKSVVVDSTKVSFILFRVMIPIIIVVKILKELELVQYMAMPLAPFMEFVGLPVQTGLVWATAMVVNIYSAIIVYVSLVPDMPTISVAQVTILSTMMLIAHSLPVELKVAQESGVSLVGQLLIRVLSAYICGLFMYHLFDAYALFQEPSSVLFTAPAEESSLWAWAWSQVKKIFSIYVIILVLMGFMRVLNFLRITALFSWILSPVLRLMGIGRSAAGITIVGLTLGISYGSGLIIHEAKSGRITRSDLFASLTLMGLAHALVEDTFLMALIGANLVGTFWIRLVFSIVAVAILARIWNKWMQGRQR